MFWIEVRLKVDGTDVLLIRSNRLAIHGALVQLGILWIEKRSVR